MLTEESCCGSSMNLEAKLRDILSRLEKQGREYARSADRLADKISGSLPTDCCNESCPRQIPNNLHQITDEIMMVLGDVLSGLNGSLERAHNAVGVFDETTCVPEPPLRTGIVKQQGRM